MQISVYQSSEIFTCTLMHILGGGILSCTTGYQFVGEEYCLARPDIRLPNSRHVESVCLLSRVSNRKPDAQIKLTLDMEDYYRIKDAKGGESDE